MILRSIRQEERNMVVLSWDDGHMSPVSTRTLRDRCPCAACSGETVLFQSYIPKKPDTSTPGRYELRSITPVGNYAIKMVWGDGHDLGVYSWEHLRSLCECGDCISLGGKKKGSEVDG